MKKFIALILFSLVSISITAKPILAIQTWQTPNGVKVFFVPLTQLPILDINVVFKAGSAWDQQQFGLSSLTNNLLGEGAKGLTADQIAQSFDAVGASFNSNSDRDMASLSLRTLVMPAYLKTALNTFSAVLGQPTFTEEALKRVQKQTQANIQYNTQDPSYVAKEAFYQFAYAKEPYGHPVLGTLNSVPKLTMAMVKAFYSQYYVASNAQIILVGDISREKAEEIANEVTVHLQKGIATPDLKNAEMTEKPEKMTIDFPSSQTALVIGQVGINRSNPDYYPLIVGNYLLGGLPLNSILFHQIRDQRGLAYGVTSDFDPLLLKGPFLIQLKTRNEQAEKALTVVQETLANFVQKGPTDSEVIAAKQNLVGGFPLMIDSNSNIVKLVTNIAFYHRPLDYLDHYRANIQAVSARQIRQAFSKLIDPKKQITVCVGHGLE